MQHHQTMLSLVRSFKACPINQAEGFLIRWNGHTGKFVLRDSKGKLITASRSFAEIERKAESITDSKVYRLPVAA